MPKDGKKKKAAKKKFKLRVENRMPTTAQIKKLPLSKQMGIGMRKEHNMKEIKDSRNLTPRLQKIRKANKATAAKKKKASK